MEKLGMRGIVIVGTGEAGTTAALTLRELGWSGPVTLLGAEPHAPYERPPLSKQALSGTSSPAALADAARLAELGIDWLPGAVARSIDRGGRRVLLADGRELPYERLLLATGASARRLPAHLDHPSFLTLRGWDDAVRLRHAIERSSRLAVVGAGFLGLEVAAAARMRGLEVNVIDAALRVLARGVPAALAAPIDALHRVQGVALHLESAIIASQATGDGGAVFTLTDGRTIEADVVLLAVGAEPRAELAAAAGLALDDHAIAVDAHLATDDEAVFAAGDCCSALHPRRDARRERLQSWRHAIEQGRTVAANLMGVRQVCNAVPWFWSDQYDQTLQISGWPDPIGPSLERRTERATLWFQLDTQGRLAAAGGFGMISAIARDLAVAQRLIASEARPDPQALTDSNLPLRRLL